MVRWLVFFGDQGTRTILWFSREKSLSETACDSLPSTMTIVPWLRAKGVAFQESTFGGLFFSVERCVGRTFSMFLCGFFPLKQEGCHH